MTTEDDTPTMTELLAAVQDLATKYQKSTQETQKVLREVQRRRRDTWIVGGLGVLIVAIITTGGLVLRRNDQHVESERRDHLAAQIFTQRTSLVQGCERGNDQRLTLAQIITIAVTPQPIPPDLTPDLQDLYRQGQDRVLALRAKLLSLPGVQVVDCQAAFPPPAPSKK